jgi:hypothetical protein
VEAFFAKSFMTICDSGSGMLVATLLGGVGILAMWL